MSPSWSPYSSLMVNNQEKVPPGTNNRLDRSQSGLTDTEVRVRICKADIEKDTRQKLFF